MNIIPSGYEEECKTELKVKDLVKIVADSQLDDSKPRCIGRMGTIIEVDPTDEWAYRVMFRDGTTNWFKRYILQRVK